MENELDKMDEFIKNFYDKISDNTTSILDNFKIGSEVTKTEEKTDDETYNQFEDLK